MTRSKAYFKSRLARFQGHFPKMKVEGFVIENPTDLAYFTGLKLSRGRLLIGPKSATLFVDGRYKEVAKKGSPYPVKELGDKTLKDSVIKLKGVKRYGFDTALSVSAFRIIKKSFVKRILKGFDHPTLAARAIKDRSELLLLQKSADLLWKGFLHVRKKLRVGVQEIALAREFEFYVKKLGAEALAFEPVIAFGENSALPHHHSGQRKLKKGEIVLMDVGVVLKGYASDMTRVIFFGKVSQKIQDIYGLVRKAHQAALDVCRAGESVALLDQIARESMGKEQKHFIHALGHGIGLDVHEFPRISMQSEKEILQEGMVITIEPGIYLPGIGGVRYEDMVVITKQGYRNLFKTTAP